LYNVKLGNVKRTQHRMPLNTTGEIGFFYYNGKLSCKDVEKKTETRISLKM
jgi:hypothetical protein